MKNLKIVILLITVLTSTLVLSQTQESKESKMLDFVSKKGIIIKFEDFNLPSVKSTYSNCESKIRKIISGSEIKYFLQISNKGKYNSVTSSIAYEDIVEIQKALVALQTQAAQDILTKADYLENKFISDDRLQIGYYVNKNKIVWYMKLDSGSDSTIFFKTYEPLVNAFKLGKEKIIFLKQQ
ncbi:hypothetical protein IMCC3317_24610 [Kordia antarctica]|uniref:Uncharacterized protein n=1 Tax=Kordia antarctica TaxID=1218801 RepID=A0A7L4ZK49_9FLAO|nr:hypothetical protein IMCC3317_24610 [Kordia antarctica]